MPQPSSSAIIASPYDWRETLALAGRNLFGANRRRHRGLVPTMPPQVTWCKDLQQCQSIVFIGDIMGLAQPSEARPPLHIGTDLRRLIQHSDYLVANLEGSLVPTAHPAKRRPGCWIGFEQQLPEQTLAVLADLKAPQRTYLSVANNHLGDYQKRTQTTSLALLQQYQFHYFGLRSRPYVDLPTGLRLVAGSQWSNQPCSELQPLQMSLVQHRHPERLNVLCPHWGHELEWFPRPALRRTARAYARDFDAIVGHHSHTPQPIALEAITPAPSSPQQQRLVAYSLGNFATRLSWLRQYRYGQLLRLRFGQDDQGRFQWASAERHYLHISPRRYGPYVDLCPQLEGVHG